MNYPRFSMLVARMFFLQFAISDVSSFLVNRSQAASVRLGRLNQIVALSRPSLRQQANTKQTTKVILVLFQVYGEEPANKDDIEALISNVTALYMDVMVLNHDVTDNISGMEHNKKGLMDNPAPEDNNFKSLIVTMQVLSDKVENNLNEFKNTTIEMIDKLATIEMIDKLENNLKDDIKEFKTTGTTIEMNDKLEKEIMAKLNKMNDKIDSLILSQIIRSRAVSNVVNSALIGAVVGFLITSLLSLLSKRLL
jgi:hypothetical protein